jgi:hypothetical protein
MRKILFIKACILLFGTYSIYGQLCTPNGISTNPDNPVNPQAPFPEFLNSFNWFDIDGITLVQYPIHDMHTQFDQPSMFSPFSHQNSGYGHITESTLLELDMYYDMGWELLSVNLGAYPDGTLLSEMLSPQISGYPEIPYVLLYNKKRGLIRLFANSLTGLDPGFDHVVVKLMFNNFEELSGLLMPYNQYSSALDQPTEYNEVITTVPHPNNSVMWFYSDFQVGFDPCTCLFRSDLKLQFQFVNFLEINMVSNEVSLDVALVDNSGNLTINEDFLTSVQYNNGFEGSGLLVYGEMMTLVDDYIAKLEEIEQYNLDVEANLKRNKRKKIVLQVFKQIVVEGTSTLVGPLVLPVLNSAADLIKDILNDDQIKVDKNKVTSEVKKILGEQYDSFSKEWLDSPTDKKPTPTVPTARISQSTFNGEIVNNTAVNGPTLFNPGTYPTGTGNVEVTAHSYPVYNEILGLFALLESPQFMKYADWEHNIINANFSTAITENDDPESSELISLEMESDYIQRFKLSAPLKLAYNPASGMTTANCIVQAQLVAEMNLPGASSLNDGSLLTYWQDDISRAVLLNNITEENSGSANIILDNNGRTLRLQSNFIDLNNFNEQTFELDYKVFNTYWYQGSSLSQTEMEESMGMLESLIPGSPLNETGFQLYLKLLVNMPFAGDNPTVTTQVFTYKINPSQIIDTPTEIPIPWSFTENPNGNGSDALAHTLYFEDKNWNLNDYAQYGGTNGNIARPHALTSVLINGNQTKNQLEEVVITAGDEIVVTGESTIAAGFTLRIEDVVQMTSSPTPSVTNEFLTSFCGGQQPNQYNANQSRFTPNTHQANVSSLYQKMLKSDNALSIYPNPVSESIGIFVPECRGLALISIHNTMGELVDSFSNMTDASGLNCYRNLSHLSNGTYTITVKSDGTWFTDKFVVVR